MKLLAVLLLLGMFSLSVAEVVDSFKETCPQFFIKDNNNQAVPPTVFEGDQYKQICQFYKGDYRFATLYDTNHRIPVYSAYTYSFPEPRGIDYKRWKIEPQLDEPRTNNNREMREEELNQALDKDYTINSPNKEDTSPNKAKTSSNKANYSPNKAKTSLDIKYTRGHVFPKSYALGTQQKESTFTFTNAAPQTEKSNGKWAEKVEIPMRKKIKENCDNKSLVYIVTGVVPGETWLPIKRGGKTINKGVNIPRYFWTAFSCKPKKNSDIDSLAYIAEQITDLPAKNLDIAEQITTTPAPVTKELTVKELNEQLGELYETPFHVFG